jgi:hypothetical protein
MSEPTQAAEPPAEKKRRRLPTLKQAGDWAGSVAAIIGLVILVAGGIAAGVTNHFTGWITGGESAKGTVTKQVATIRLSQRRPTAQDDQADTYTLVLRFQGFGGDPCTIEWQRTDGANSLIDPVAHSVPCAASGAFEQKVRIPVPQRSGDSYRTTFELHHGARSFGHATTAPQFIP